MHAGYNHPQHPSSPPPLHYRDGPPLPPHGQYHIPPTQSVAQSQHHPPPPQQQQPHSQMAHSYADQYGLAPLAPGQQPIVAEPMPRSCVENGRRYELKVIQQPKRARMCGFGDKDRRPITPPPCVRVIVTDALSGKEIDVNDIDHTMFVLNVDLWSQDGSQQVNLVRHSPTSPGIPSTTPVTYQQSIEGGPTYSHPQSGQYGQRENQSAHGAAYPSYSTGPAANPYAQQSQQPPYSSGGHYSSSYAPTTNGTQAYSQNGFSQTQTPYYTTGSGVHGQGNEPPGGRAYQQPPTEPSSNRAPSGSSQPTGMYTRNLIGSLTAAAFRLTDPNDHIGIWFVLQDLSVRTEGIFRLRFSFVNVGISPPSTSLDPTNPQGGPQQQMPHVTPQVNTGKAPVLAACFSDCFTVYSAKRFPGVVESTALSKCFSMQGIKIPIRKEAPGRGGRHDEYDED